MIEYYNSNSTKADNGMYNPNDIYYPEVQELREKEIKFKDMIKRYVNADKSADVIFTSGSAESIATIMHWAKRCIQYGTCIATSNSHPLVKLNAENYELEYREDDEFNYHQYDREPAVIFLTHASPYDGSIFDIDKYIDKYEEYDIDTFDESKRINYRPIIAIDCCQSIKYIQPDMKRWHADVLFFSLHKIGGEFGTGVMVLNHHVQFIPLIAGNGLRGGTPNTYNVIKAMDQFSRLPLPMHSQHEYKELVDKFKSKGYEVYTTNGKHLNTTIKIKPKNNDCVFNEIRNLALQGIYVSGPTACSTEDLYIRVSI